MPGGFAFDDSAAPLVVARLWGALSDEEFREYLAAHDAVMARGRRVVVVIDARAAEPAPASQRKMQADWLAAREPRLRELLLGMAFVVKSPVVRAIITAVFWFKPLPCAHVVVATLQEALAWVNALCAQRGVAAPRVSSALPIVAASARATAAGPKTGGASATPANATGASMGGATAVANAGLANAGGAKASGANAGGAKASAANATGASMGGATAAANAGGATTAVANAGGAKASGARDRG